MFGLKYGALYLGWGEKKPRSYESRGLKNGVMNY